MRSASSRAVRERPDQQWHGIDVGSGDGRDAGQSERDAHRGRAGRIAEDQPAAVSGAVRQLIQVSFISRERLPGSRKDHYRIREDVFAAILERRNLA